MYSFGSSAEILVIRFPALRLFHGNNRTALFSNSSLSLRDRRLLAEPLIKGDQHLSISNEYLNFFLNQCNIELDFWLSLPGIT